MTMRIVTVDGYDPDYPERYCYQWQLIDGAGNVVERSSEPWFTEYSAQLDFDTKHPDADTRGGDRS